MQFGLVPRLAQHSVTVSNELRIKLYLCRCGTTMPGDKPTPYAFAPSKHGGKLVHGLGEPRLAVQQPLTPSPTSQMGSISSGSTIDGARFGVPDMTDSEGELVVGELFERRRTHISTTDDTPITTASAETSEAHGCKCGKCAHMPLAIENICCSRENLRETHLTDYQPGMCVLETREILHVLHPISIQCAWMAQKRYFGHREEDLNFNNMTNKDYRYHAYRQYIMYMNAKLGRYNRKVIPACVV